MNTYNLMVSATIDVFTENLCSISSWSRRNESQVSLNNYTWSLCFDDVVLSGANTFVTFDLRGAQ